MSDTKLDHVALAVRRWTDARPALIDRLAGAPDDSPGATPPAGIQALALTASAGPEFPVETHASGRALTPVLPELGIRLLAQVRSPRSARPGPLAQVRSPRSASPASASRAPRRRHSCARRICHTLRRGS